MAARDTTQLLVEWRKGDQEALAELMVRLEAELRRMARKHLARPGRRSSLQTVDLVNEMFLRLVDQKVSWQNRAHFLAIAARLMRRVLGDDARTRLAAKRGAGRDMASLSEAVGSPAPRGINLEAVLDVHRALLALEAVDPRRSEVVELRVFAGLTVEEMAEALGRSPATVKRDWAGAKAWLQREISRGRRA